MMLEHGMRPTAATVNHLLSACAANRALEPAMSIFGSLKVSTASFPVALLVAPFQVLRASCAASLGIGEVSLLLLFIAGERHCGRHSDI